MPFSKTLLVILPQFFPKMPPIGLGYLQGFLENKGVACDILDLNNIFYNISDKELKKEWLVSSNISFEKNIMSNIKNNHPAEYNFFIQKTLQYDFIGFAVFKSNILSTIEAARLLKKKRKDIRIIFGGPEITRQFFKGKGKIGKDILNSADFFVVGEGERPLYEYLSGRKFPDNIARFQELQNFDEIPFPEYRGLELKNYPRIDAIPVQFSRGCVRRCNFCSERLLYKGFRRRPVKSVIDEIKFHRIKNNTKSFVFFDSLINGDLEALEELCDAIIANFGSINFEAQIAVRRDMKEGLFEKLKKSGCYNLFVGLESGSRAVLKKMNKGFSPNEAEIFFSRLKNAGLSFGISIIVGYPGETEKDFKDGLNFIIRNKDIIPKIEQVNPFTYYDGAISPKNGDYKLNKTSLKRMEIFIREIKKNNFRYTNAFLGNLIEK